MTIAWLGPVLLGLLLTANGADALVRKRVFVAANRDPDAAVYREFQPVPYWLLVGLNFALAAVCLVAAYYLGQQAG